MRNGLSLYKTSRALESYIDPGSNELLIADPKDEAVLAFKTTTNQISRVALPPEIPPTSITKIQGGFLVKYRDDASIISMDRKPIPTTNLRTTKAGGLTGLGSLYSNWITKGTSFVGYGSVVRKDLTAQDHDPARGFQLGFIRGTVTARSGRFTILNSLKQPKRMASIRLAFLTSRPMTTASSMSGWSVTRRRSRLRRGRPTARRLNR